MTNTPRKPDPNRPGYLLGETWWQRFRRVSAEQSAEADARRSRNEKLRQDAMRMRESNYRSQYAPALPSASERPSAPINWASEANLGPDDEAFFAEFKKAAENENRQKVLEEQERELQRYIKNIQSLMFSNMRDINNHLAPLDEIYKKQAFNEKIHKLEDSVREGSYLNLITDVGAEEGGIGSFIHATPAQLALLQPLLRFYLVDQGGKEIEEIYFSDHFNEKHFKEIANKRRTADIYEALKPGTRKGSDVGIKSFSWNYFNKHEGDFIIEAKLQLYFGTLAELINAEYLKFLFPTGTAKELAADLTSGINSINKAERTKNNKRLTRKDVIKNDLQKRIDIYTKYLDANKSDREKIPELIDKDKSKERKKEFLQLKVIVGWNIPKGNEQELRKLFSKQSGFGSYHSFKRGLLATQKVIFLNLVDYNVNFEQSGPTTLDLSYVGSSDNYLASAGSDIFGSSNVDSLDKKFIYQETPVSIENFINIAGNIIDTNRTSVESAAENARTSTSSDEEKPSYRLRSVKEAGDIYLLNCAHRLGLKPNDFGEKTITVTLGGLRKAQELAELRLKLYQLMNVDENARHVEKLRQSGQLLTLLYQRVYDIRLREIYSSFLDGFLAGEGDFVKKATIISEGGSKPRIVYGELSEKDKKLLKKDPTKMFEDELRKKFNGFGPDLPPSPGSVTVYYMRLGDIIRKAMKDAQLREDVSLILGNSSKLVGEDNLTYSIYDIPVTMDTFGQFFYDRVVSKKKKTYPFRYFLNDILKVVARFINQDPTVYDRISFDYTVLSGVADHIEGFPAILRASDQLSKIKESQIEPLAQSGKKFQHFYPIYAAKNSMKNRVGDRFIDEREGIMHYVIGSDRGLAKEFNFSRQDTQYFQEMLIESNNLDDKIQALFLPQNVSIRMFGNTLHKNGDLIFVDSRPSLGGFAGPVLGIGGYYRVISSTHTITNRGYETELSCVFELRVTPDKSKNKRVR